MRLRIALLSALVLASGALAARAALQEGMPPPAKPGPEHELLKHFAGTFDLLVDGSEKGTETTTLAMNGLWAVSDFQSQMGGQAFIGHGVLGWDANKKKYISTWVDTMSTHLYVFEGTWDAATKTLVQESTEPDPMMGQKMVSKTRITDADHHVFEMHVGSVDTPAMMSIQYTRKK